MENEIIIFIDKPGSLEGMKRGIDLIKAQPGIETLIILTCDENTFTIKQLNTLLMKTSIPLLGGIFPALIIEKTLMKRGSILIGVPHKMTFGIMNDLSNPELDFEASIEAKFPNPLYSGTLFFFVDGFSKRINALIEALFNVFGLEINYLGGGAGSLSVRQQPCLLTNKGVIKDAAILAWLPLKSGVGVAHGWQSISVPFKITKSHQNTIFTLDWKPAFDVYRSVVESHSGKSFNNSNFFDLAKAYPFGIAKIGSERIVRDPFISGDDGSLTCIGEVESGSFVEILYGEEASIIKAAARALNIANKYLGEQSGDKISLFFDCISRVLFLDKKFIQELKSVYETEYPLIGICSIGEIANSGYDYLEFYNKTAVICKLETTWKII